MFGMLNYSFSHLCKEENETPGWTQLKLPGQAPSSRCGHSVTSRGHYVSPEPDEAHSSGFTFALDFDGYL